MNLNILSYFESPNKVTVDTFSGCRRTNWPLRPGCPQPFQPPQRWSLISLDLRASRERTGRQGSWVEIWLIAHSFPFGGGGGESIKKFNS